MVKDKDEKLIKMPVHCVVHLK